ncbi:MAG: hypothetical protein ACRD13_13035, partial [Terriglobales bacterium]
MNAFPVTDTSRPAARGSWRARGRALIACAGALFFGLCVAFPAWAQQPNANVTNAFGAPSTNVAHAIDHISWATFWIIIPFIVIAEVLLLVVIFKFRRRQGDQRQPAKFYE